MPWSLIWPNTILAGFKFGQERGGPLGAVLGGQTATCFCSHCQGKAVSEGLDAEAARRGFLELREFVLQARTEGRPRDGFLISFFRVLMRHPEVLAWERFWMRSREDQRRRIHAKLKSIRPAIQIGWHIDHGMSWDPITRAAWDYEEMVPHSDWLSIALYFCCMGPRSFNHFRNRYESLLLADTDPETAYAAYLGILGFDPAREPGHAAQLDAPQPFSPDYVRREALRAVHAVRGRARVYARIGFDVPMHPVHVPPAAVRESVLLALDAGVDGLFMGREWEELKPENARAFGDAVRDWQRR